jgi:hypothetical protein
MKVFSKGAGKICDTISPRGQAWDELREELYTPEEIRESDIRVAIMSELIKARNDLTYHSATLNN